MKKRLLITTLALAAVAAASPPVPPICGTRLESPKGREQRLSVRMRVVVPQRRITIAWSYRFDLTDIVFNVRRLATNQIASPSYSWPIVVSTAMLEYSEPIDTSAQCVWFTVTASNVVSRVESGFATK